MFLFKWNVLIFNVSNLWMEEIKWKMDCDNDKMIK